MMERFLEAQRAWDQTETELAAQFLNTQAATAAAVMSLRPTAVPLAPAAPPPVARPRPFLGEIQRMIPGQETGIAAGTGSGAAPRFWRSMLC